MKTFIKNSCALLVMCSWMTPAQPNPIALKQDLHENTAKGLAIGGGVLAGAATGLGVYYLGLKDSTMSTLSKSIIIGLSAASVGALTWWALDSYLYTLTPRGKMAAANKIINWVEMDSLIAREFTKHEDVVSHTNARFGTSWPLVLARNHLMLISTNLSQALALSQSAYQEAAGKAEYADLCQNCKAIEAKGPIVANKIEERINYIAQRNEYLDQVKLHEKFLEEERKRQHQKEMQAEKLNHQSYENSKDRWSTSSEKDRDRLFKERLTQGNNRPIMVGI